ncbi:hypothetical protein [Hymenobacter metallicola]|uniref:Uncharacterized protein n=1 Tax=Hymenobacter metallicola TaxID=2563114 RepID=A0A4Z0PZQ0_9BACT|nr:hypothetical protein [Hymenobacter metallicola]TGE22794.1 hypothetical protein E5K02_20735 [Hymenobacter metallicola]
MVDTSQTKATDTTYHVRCLGSAKLRQALQNEQARRFLQTGQKVNVMDIASEWLEEKASQMAA